MKKHLFLIVISFVVLLGYGVYQYFKLNDNKLHVVFCNVGQGDSIFIRTPSGRIILIDGGPDDRVLDCLSRHIPFWERSISVVILSHPHQDHLVGLLSVLRNYRVQAFATENLANTTDTYKVLMESVRQNGLKTQFLIQGKRINARDGVVLTIVGPSNDYLKQTSPNGIIAEKKEFANVESLLTYGNFSVLFTGDSQAAELQNAVDNGLLKAVVALQVPHHGSSTGLSDQLIQTLSPKLVVISVGAKNRYGHPSPFTISLLRQKNIKTLQTDQNGEVEIVSDGKALEVKAQKN